MADFAGAEELPVRDAGAKSKDLPARKEWAITVICLGGLVLLSIGLRLLPVVFVPSINWYDEIFQAIEPAHRLVYGYGLVPWEFQLGMRSWLLPGAIAGLIQLSRVAGDGPGYYLPVIATAFALLASVPVVCCFLWARRWFGLAGALAAGGALAIAPELVYFGARALSEVIAAQLLVLGCYVLEPGYRVESRRRLFAAGLLLGLVCLLRVQLAPAVALIAIWTVWRDWRARFPAILTGALLVFALGTVLDWLTLGQPLASLWRNVLYNLIYGVSADFGTEPWHFYLLGELGVWGPGVVVLLLLAFFGARRLPGLIVAAAIILVVHSCIAHKEYRFIYPAVLLLVTLAAIGLAQLADWGARWFAGRGMRERAAAAVSAGLVFAYWGVTSFNLWTGDTLAQLRHRASDNLAAMSFAARLPGLCGLGLYGLEGKDWVWYGGYTHLHRPLPMYWPKDAVELAATAPAFDTLLYTEAPLPAGSGFTTARCFGQICVARRSGKCETQPMISMPFPEPIIGMAPPREAFEALPKN